MNMTSTRFRCALLLFLYHLSTLAVSAEIYSEYIPNVYKVNQRQTECIYDRFDKSDFVTFSVFVVQVLNNGNPIAAIKFEGPVSGNMDVLKAGNINYDTTTDESPSLGRELRRGAHVHWPQVKDIDKQVRYDKRIGIINRNVKVDWTHAGEHEDAVAARAQIEEERKEAYKSQRDKPRSDIDAEAMEKKNEKFRTITQEKIEPYEETNAIKAAGWYRVCVTAEYAALLVEMELRSGNALGGVDRKTGHVYTYEDREMLNQQQLLDEKITAKEEEQSIIKEQQKEIEKHIENQVKEQDLHPSKAQIKHLNSMITEMKKKLSEHHHRIKSHEDEARRNRNRIFKKGLFQTISFLAITLFQVYTIQNWLLSNNTLGRA